MKDREPPPDHIGVPEAAERLNVHPDTIRNWLKAEPQEIAGQVVWNSATNRNEYWVLIRGDSTEGTPTLEEVLERRTPATRAELETAEERVISMIERNLRVVGPKLDEVSVNVNLQRQQLGSGQQEILGVVRTLADSLERIAQAEERNAAELSNLNRWLEDLHSGAQKDRNDASKDRDAMRLILQELVRQGRMPEVEEEPKPWWKRLFGG